MSPSPSPPTVPPLLLGLSGPSSSGKTTLARLLRDIFNVTTTSISVSLTILHQDDFYLTDAQIPLITTSPDCPSGLGSRELQDWDCVESLDLGLLERVIGFLVREGRLPHGKGEDGTEKGFEEWDRKEDKNSVGEVGVSENEVGKLREEIVKWVEELVRGLGNDASEPMDLNIFILDGFLLYPDPSTPSKSSNEHEKQLARLLEILRPLSLRLFLPCTRSQTISRRANRTGYVTLEGFWADPPGYVEDVVWPGFVRDGGWMFKSNVDQSGQGEEDEGEIDEEIAKKAGIDVAPGQGTWEMRNLLGWGVERVKGAVEEGATQGNVA
jgi:nicotinamide/nicotinate riboside kinase